VKFSKVAAVAAGTLLAMGVAAPAFADSDAFGGAAHSPGVLSGNVVEVPVDIPVNLCGDTVDTASLLSPAFGTACVNTSAGHRPVGPRGPEQVPPRNAGRARGGAPRGPRSHRGSLGGDATDCDTDAEKKSRCDRS
jgi:hypothetical protein